MFIERKGLRIFFHPAEREERMGKKIVLLSFSLLSTDDLQNGCIKVEFKPLVWFRAVMGDFQGHGGE